MTATTITITFRFLNLPPIERELKRENVKEAVLSALDDLAEDQLDDLDMIDITSEDQFLRKL
jgi:hypothetical protein|tara:strand:+ start:2171 stop:2356 length:186 start_codon:yes stop_codon:yes gene_type:complete